MQSSAEQLKAFVKRVLHKTGAEKVDIVGLFENYADAEDAWRASARWRMAWMPSQIT